ncbi:MAG: hypothetical protein IRY97_06900 [Thermomicrobiaceae bacterium]|nr:hypothetical protein [Thermomicrobiaceae bacterium]
MGFGGGFRPYNATPFGEPEWKHLYEKITEEAMKLDHALAAVRDADYIVGVTHYSPTVDTMGDEPAALHPYLGSSELGDVLERHQVIFAVHGHAHRGRCQGCTQNGVAVYNVAMPIVGRPLVWRFEPRAGRGAPAPPQPIAVGAAVPSD